MANIVRCKTPDGTLRFKPFTVADYRDFLLVRADMANKDRQEQKQILDELMADYFHEYPKAWHPFLFIKVFTSSIGKTKIPVVFECDCGKTKQVLFNLSIEELKAPVIETSGLKIEFSFPDELTTDATRMILDNIKTVTDSEKTYKWSELSDEEQLAVIDAIDYTSLESLLNQMKPINFKIKYGCCKKYESNYDDILDVFKIIVNSSEIFVFYQVNHMLIKHDYNLESIMQMIPVERNIALSLVEKDLKKGT